MGSYSSQSWAIAEYLALFGIVLMHEFGHALACRQVGGDAHEILLWPFGGVAYVSPPPRPGAVLWSIAAGPLVNVVLFPVLTLVTSFLGTTSLAGSDLYELVRAVRTINTYLLIFNLLPIYPLDGGQILQALLWFGLGRAKSLFVATIVGFVGVAALTFWAIQGRSLWLGVLTFYVFQQCLAGFQQARAAMALARQGH